MSDSSVFHMDVKGLPGFVHAMNAAPATLNAEMFVAARRISFRGESLSKQYAPVFDGTARASIWQRAEQSTGGVSAKWGASAEHAIYADKGTRPHFPPIKAITPWAEAHGIEPFVLARSISRKGTKAHPFVTRAFNEIKTAFARDEFRDAIRRALAKIGGSR